VTRYNLLSEQEERLRGQYTISHTATAKLLRHFFDKTKMLLHYRNLNSYLKHGMVVTKMHRGIQFRQSKWLALYMRTDTEVRALAKNAVQVKLRKDMSNIMHGKACENPTKRTDIRLVNTQRK
jgi:hypothetical protein